MARNIFRKPARISPTFILHWRRRWQAAMHATGQLEARAADGKLAPGGCAIELCRGIRAFAEGDNDGAVRLLEPAISELARIGGSHAQRELWEDTLIVACLRAGQGDKAARRISARLERRPSARDQAWSRQAKRA